MKKFNSISGSKVVIVSSVVLLLSRTGMAEYGDYTPHLKDLSTDVSKIESVLGPKKSSSGSEESFEEKIEKLSKIATSSTEEQDQRKKRVNWTKKNDTLKNIPVLLDLVTQNAIKKREGDLKTAESSLSKLGRKNSQLNPQDFSMTSMPDACRKDVDFTQAMALTEQLGSEPFKYIKNEAGKLLEEKSEDLGKKKVAKIADLMKYFKELAGKEEGDDLAKIDVLAGNNNLEERISRLKESNKKAKEENKELKLGLVDVVGKFIGDLSALEKNDKRVQQLGEEFASSIELNQKNAMLAMQQNVERLYGTCEKERRMAKIEINNFKGHLVSRGWSPDVAETDAQVQLLRANKIRCEDVSPNIQRVLSGTGTGGSNLSNRLSQIRAEKNPIKLISQALGAMEDVGKIQEEVGSQLTPLMQGCKSAALAREQLKERFNQLVGGSSQAATASGFQGSSTSLNGITSGNGVGGQSRRSSPSIGLQQPGHTSSQSGI